MTITETITTLANEKGILRPRDLKSFDIPGQYLCRLAEQGVLQRRGRGLYSLPDAPISEHDSLVQVALLVPKGIISLLSALQYHRITTQRPFEVWMTIEQNAWKPRLDYPALRITRVDTELFDLGVERHEIVGVSVPIYSVARTICDCFKHRAKIGIDVAIESLRFGWKQRAFESDEIWSVAKRLRVAQVMRPYLQSIL